MGLIQIGGSKYATVRHGKESAVNKVVVYIIIGLLKGEEGLVI